MIVPFAELQAIEEGYRGYPLKQRQIALAPYKHIRHWQDRWAGGYVYFVQEEDRGAVKIGTALNPVKRLATLQTGNPRELYLRAMLVGNQRLERALHRRYTAVGELGEWFAAGEAHQILTFGRAIADAQIEVHRQFGSIVVELDALVGEARGLRT